MRDEILQIAQAEEQKVRRFIKHNRVMPWDLWRIHLIRFSAPADFSFLDEPAIGLTFPTICGLWKGRLRFAWRLIAHHRRDDWRAVIAGIGALL